MRLIVGPALALGVITASRLAFAYCQTTTCNPADDCGTDPESCCVVDANGCDQNGAVIRWPSTCVSYGVQQDASPRHGISFQEFDATLERSFQTWNEAPCDGGLSIEALNFGAVSCGTPEYNSGDDAGNANIWMFRDASWPYEEADTGGSAVVSSTLALTTVSFNWKTAEIYDADVELNSYQANFTTGDEGVVIDLESILTHEAGHFLGLDHSLSDGSTMYPNYDPGTVGTRTLTRDDERGLCASYPIGRDVPTESCSPRGKFSADCAGGCSYLGGALKSPQRAPWLLAVPLVALVFRRRRRTAG